MKKSQPNVISALLKESDAYTSMGIIESSVQEGGDLSRFPIQPVYLALRALEPESLAITLPKLDAQQRKLFLDIDLWKKDNVDVNEFERWISSYAICPDDSVRHEFVQSEEFLLYLKSRFNIWTFDVEDPLYPDHDFYFLTDDGLLLFEFDETTPYVDQTRSLIRELYGELGVENAYALLFKFVEESYLYLQEELYQEKKGRLQDVGMIDYFDALETVALFPSLSHIDHFIKSKNPSIPNVDDFFNQQALHKNTLVGIDDFSDMIEVELNRVESEKRQTFLRWSFILLINSTIAYEQALKEGKLSMGRVGIKNRSFMTLGFHYTLKKIETTDILFEKFDFIDIYRIGKSLVELTRKEYSKAIVKLDVDREKFLTFCGKKIRSAFEYDQDNKNWGDLNQFLAWQEEIFFCREFFPYVYQFYNQFQVLIDDGLLEDHFYFNYKVVEIDFEAIILSLFANSALGLYGDEKSNLKLGLKMSEAKKFLSLYEKKKLEKPLENFLVRYKMDAICGIEDYFTSLLEEHLEGYAVGELHDEDFSHIGGPIILNIS